MYPAERGNESESDCSLSRPPWNYTNCKITLCFVYTAESESGCNQTTLESYHN